LNQREVAAVALMAKISRSRQMLIVIDAAQRRFKKDWA
jgi:hypothetical protein